MACSSSSPPSRRPRWRYDAFLNFRAGDSSMNFVNHLYKALDQNGILTYNTPELDGGGSIAQVEERMKAIEESMVVVVVFSRNYASSRWCLDELVHIMMNDPRNSHQIVLPVFYDVEPSDVRRQKGFTGEAFATHEKDQETGVRRQALEKAAEISGLMIPKGGNEAECIGHIVEMIFDRINHSNPRVDENLVGMERRMQDVKLLLEVGSGDVRMVGIWGTGGAGKTTVARAVFDEIASHFDAVCFVENIRERSEYHGLLHAQEQILSTILLQKNMKVYNLYQGREMIKRRVCNRKVLVVLDDVDDINQLEALAGSRNWFGGGSRIIVTTRDRRVLQQHRMEEEEIYNVSLLKDDEAMQLFSRYAFKKNSPAEEYRELSIQVVRNADGLPLSLKVLGSLLHGTYLNEWISALESLKSTQDKKTSNILKVSYDSLDKMQKDVFLDIACFFSGWDMGIVLKILDSYIYYPDISLRVLVDKSLVYISNNRLQMQRQLQEMGKNIVRGMHPDEPRKRSRLWHSEEFFDVLMENAGTKETEAIVLDIDSLHMQEGIKLMNVLRKMDRLRLLYFQNKQECTFQGPEYLPNTLRWLTWGFYPSESLPESFLANMLVGLEMRNSSIVQLWEGRQSKVLGNWKILDCIVQFWVGTREIKDLRNLKFLDLTGSTKLIKTPDFRGTPNLERLTLEHCSSLVEVHDSIGFLQRLVYLSLAYCISLKSFPSIIRLNSLETLDLSGCLQLKEFPESLGNLDSLSKLYLSYNVIEKIPSSIGNLRVLAQLDLTGCLQLKGLPESLGNLDSLSELNLSHNVIVELPPSIGNLHNLAHLDLTDCRYLKSLPDTIARLRCLKTLNLHGCLSLRELPENLHHLESLEKLIVSQNSIRQLPDTISRLKCLEYS